MAAVLNTKSEEFASLRLAIPSSRIPKRPLPIEGQPQDPPSAERGSGSEREGGQPGELEAAGSSLYAPSFNCVEKLHCSLQTGKSVLINYGFLRWKHFRKIT